MDQIHDPNFPLHDLEVHRRQINRMRRVSTMWNNFLLSSPRYWQVLSIKSPPPTITAGIKRSGSGPLCIYCIRSLPQPVPNQLLELVWCATRVQTLRSDDPDAHHICRVLLRTPTSTLQTLQLIVPRHLERSIEPLRDLSVAARIRHLTAVGWRPPSRGAVWLMGLKELVLHDLSQLDAETLLVLSACVNLERLVIQCFSKSHVEGPSGVPSTITLPCLQVMDLIFGSGESARSLIRRLVTPRLLRSSLDVGESALETGHRADYCRFMSQGEECAQYPKSASIRIETVRLAYTRVVYETESRRFAYERFNSQNQAQTFHDLVQEFQGLLQEPALTVTAIDSSTRIRSDDIWLFLKSIGDQNVRTIEALLNGQEADGLLVAIGAPSNRTDALATNTTTDPSFESLKSIAINNAKLDLARLTGLVETWQRHLQRMSKRWLEEVDLVGCRVREMGLGEAINRLRAIEVTLRCVRCFDFEETWF
ncbi:hypothetical protein M407DRAFT_21802 [Tulasnella calospora MUT 4182]|uniref:F-box domain-containing protein n=1 Tax=Tulasnella calospora MUT 4182 TaxID=1051891 RepID=A0A0C3QP70_9AGAM|nr:hypothetical protein M407DRAFT_21802 [Tulasnella calospora MUT 4182]